MKKIYLLVAVLAIGSVALGQRSELPAPGKITTPVKFNSSATLNKKSNSNSRSTESRWVNYADQVETNYSPSPGASGAFMLIFPDTNIIVGEYQDLTTAYPQFHKAGTILDPKNLPDGWLNSTSTYKLDSIAIDYAYARATPSNIVDTLLIEIIQHSTALEYTLTSGEASFQDIEYNYPANIINTTNVVNSYTYLLTEADSTSFLSEIAIATAGMLTEAAGNRIGVVISFKPGYTYSITDSIHEKNGFYLYSKEENGPATDPNYYGVPFDYAEDMNCSYALPTSVRYDYNGNGWNGYMIPTWAWALEYAYEHHSIWFQLTIEGVGIAEQEFTNGIKLGQNVPNPSNNNANITYEISKASKINFIIRDITGKKVMEITEGQKAAGQYTLDVNTGKLSGGVYYYTLFAGENSLTKKMVIVE